MGQLRSAIGDVFAYSATHDQKRTGDLISRVTDDIEAIQSFIITGLTGILINAMTVLGMFGVMFYLNWKFTLIALSVVPVLFSFVYMYTKRIKRASREERKKEGTAKLTPLVGMVVAVDTTLVLGSGHALP